MNFLDEIVAKRKSSVEQAKAALSIERLKSLVRGTRPAADFKKALRRQPRERIRVIAEIKRASPSKGTIADGIDPALVASDYRDGGASAISVLTEPSYFHGSSDDLKNARDSVPAMPILRKDFVVDEYQIYESLLLGADAILLIVAALTERELKKFKSVADDCGLDSLVEVHKEKELESALNAGAEIVGVNNRDLATFEVSPKVSETISKTIPAQIVSVSESGITGLEGLRAAAALGYHAVLVGEHFMRAKDRVTELKRFTSYEIPASSGRQSGN